MTAGFNVGLDDNQAETTYDIPLSFDAQGNTDAFITVLGKNSKAFRDTERTLNRVALKKSAVRGRPLDLKKDSDSDEFIESRELHNVTIAVAVTTGWTNLQNGDAEYVYSTENAKDLYTKNVHVLNKVLAALEDQANFLKA